MDSEIPVIIFIHTCIKNWLHLPLLFFLILLLEEEGRSVAAVKRSVEGLACNKIK